MDWLLFFLGTPNPLVAISMLETLRTGVLLMACLGAVIVFVSGMFMSSGHPELWIASIIVGVIMFGGGLHLGWHVIPGWQQDFNNQRPFEIEQGKEFNTSEFQEIISIGDGQSNSISGKGRFFLGIGALSIVGGDTRYFYYKKDGPGYSFDSVPTTGTIIIEDGDADPRVEWVTHHSISEKKIYTDNYQLEGGTETKGLFVTFIHVPKETIKRAFILDTKV
jgi:hypothetical protein